MLHVAHLHHCLRGVEADEDLEFARVLAGELSLPFHEARVDTNCAALPDAKTQKPYESIEEAARRLRYGWFRELMCAGHVDAVATAHTLDDQAETVLGKFLRGAWTEGLSGIHPVVEFPEGRILRPLLGVTRAEVEAYLRKIGQSWREDSSNRDPAYTRNRIRHELLPLLESWNPRLREHLAQMAVLAGDEEDYWQDEIATLAQQLILPGRPMRGGGRVGTTDLAIDLVRLTALDPALQRRLLRYAARQLGAAPDFAATEALRELALTGRAGQKLELAAGLRAERSHRELRLTVSAPKASTPVPEYRFSIPGEVDAPAFGLKIRVESCHPPDAEPVSLRRATLRNWRSGDRVWPQHTSAPRKVSEVLDRLKITGEGRVLWPVLEVDGQILWMQGVELQPGPLQPAKIRVFAADLDCAEPHP